jgi:hypothetical protein
MGSGPTLLPSTLSMPIMMAGMAAMGGPRVMYLAYFRQFGISNNSAEPRQVKRPSRWAKTRFIVGALQRIGRLAFPG